MNVPTWENRILSPPIPLRPATLAVSMFAMSRAPRPARIPTDARRLTVVKVSSLTIPVSRYPRPPAFTPLKPDLKAMKTQQLRSSHCQESKPEKLPENPSDRGRW
ncbi:hypothetical protein SK1NUM_20930 [Arachnia rubra]|nr:hypothetical protein SK1NUM_20930 [Arachnia rubra]